MPEGLLPCLRSRTGLVERERIDDDNVKLAGTHSLYIYMYIV